MQSGSALGGARGNQHPETAVESGSKRLTNRSSNTSPLPNGHRLAVRIPWRYEREPAPRAGFVVLGYGWPLADPEERDGTRLPHSPWLGRNLARRAPRLARLP